MRKIRATFRFCTRTREPKALACISDFDQFDPISFKMVKFGQISVVWSRSSGKMPTENGISLWRFYNFVIDAASVFPPSTVASHSRLMQGSQLLRSSATALRSHRCRGRQWLSGESQTSTSAQSNPSKLRNDPYLIPNDGSAARDHLANERTFLAWSRTGLGFVALGVGIDGLGRYSLGSDDPMGSRSVSNSRSVTHLVPPAGGVSSASEIAEDLLAIRVSAACCIASGVFILTKATVRFYAVQRALISGKFRLAGPSIAGAIVVTSALTATALGVLFARPFHGGVWYPSNKENIAGGAGAPRWIIHYYYQSGDLVTSYNISEFVFLLAIGYSAR